MSKFLSRLVKQSFVRNYRAMGKIRCEAISTSGVRGCNLNEKSINRKFSKRFSPLSTFHPTWCGKRARLSKLLSTSGFLFRSFKLGHLQKEEQKEFDV